MDNPRDGSDANKEESGQPTTSALGDEDAPLSEQDRLLVALEEDNLPDFRNLLRSPKVDPSHRYGKPHYSTILEIASRRKHGRPYVKLLLSHVRPSVNKILPEPIHYAAKNGNCEVLEELLQDKRTKANAHDSHGRTALHYACVNVHPKNVRGYKQCVRLIMQYFKPADVNKTDVNGFSAIHAAAREKLIRRKSTHGADATAADEGENVTDADMWEARKELVLIILELGLDLLDIDSEVAKGRTAREDLLQRFPDLEHRLPSGRDVLQADSHSALVNALRDGRIGMFKALLELTDADGNPRLNPNHWFGIPLHATCLEVACRKRDGADFVKALLNAGADPNMANKLDGKFPIHIACEKALDGHLKAIFEYSKATDPNGSDKFGNTALHYVVEKWSGLDAKTVSARRNCLDILLCRENIDVNKRNKEQKTALMLALHSKIKYVVSRIIEKKCNKLDLNLKFQEKTVRQMIEETFPDLVEKLTLSDIPGDNLDHEWFHLLYKSRETDFVKKLETQQPSDLSMNDRNDTLLQRAATYGMEKAVKALLKAGADPNKTFERNRCPPAILAICNNHYDVVEHFLSVKEFDINCKDSKGNTLLYYATSKKDGYETVIKLLRQGADPEIHNKLGKPCFDKEKLQSLLDHCIQTNDVNSRSEDYEIILDYRLLAVRPENEDTTNSDGIYEAVPREERINLDESVEDDVLFSEMDFLYKMSKKEELCSLLDHPVVSSFLQMKWNRVKKLTHINLGIYVAFVLFLNIYIIHSGTVKKYFSQELQLNSTNSTRIVLRANPLISALPLAVITLFLWLYLLLREIVQFSMDRRKYIGSYENYLDWSILMFSFVAILMPIIQPNNRLHSFLNVLTIMLSCTELLVLLGRISRFATYIEMLKVVVKSYVWPLLSYSIIIIAFGLSFHTLFSESHESFSRGNKHLNVSDESEEEFSGGFETWYMSIITSLVMMTGELNFSSFSNHSFLSVVLFVFFVLLVTVILLNLLIGLAVSDTQRIESDANELRLKTRIEVVAYAESILVNLHNAKLCIFRKLTTSRKLREKLKGAVLFPVITQEKLKGRVKPNEKALIYLGEEKNVEHEVDQMWLDRATQIISKRSTEKAIPEVSLNALKEQLDSIQKFLQARGAFVEGHRPLRNGDSINSIASTSCAQPDNLDSVRSSVFCDPE